jgi:hypothetical protein
VAQTTKQKTKNAILSPCFRASVVSLFRIPKTLDTGFAFSYYEFAPLLIEAG